MALRLLGFFLQANRFAVRIELDHAVALRVADLIAENACASLDRERVARKVEFPIEDVVAKNQRCARIPDKFCSNQKCLRDPFRLRLLGVLNADAELRAVAQVILQHWQIFRRRDDKYLAKTAEHQSRQWIADHRLVVYRQKLFADDFRQRKETCSRATGEKNGFFVHKFSSPRIT